MKRRPGSLFPAPVAALDRTTLPSGGASPQYIIIAILLLGLIIALAWRTIDSSPLLLHLKAGEQILATKTVPKSDVFSAASSRDGWTYIEWGWGTILAAAFKQAKWYALSAISVLCIAATAGLMLIRSRRRGARWFESIFTAGFCLAALIPTFQPDPATAAGVLFLLALLIGESRRLWPLIFLPLIIWIWSNLHPACLLVIMVPLARLIFPPRAENGSKTLSPIAYLLVIIVGCLVASTITPYSIQTPQAVWGTLRVTASESVQNWQQIYLEPALLLRITAAIALAITILLSRKVLRNWEKAATIILALFSLVTPAALNFLLLYLAAPAAASLTQLLAATWRTAIIRQAAGVAFILAILAMSTASLALARLSTNAFGAGIRSATFPEAATGRLASLPLRNAILHDPRDGGFIAWRAWPSWKITMDDRLTLYPADSRQQYELLWQAAPGWEKILTHWRVQAVLGRPELLIQYPDNNLLKQLALSSDWKPVYWDSQSILYVRADVDLGTSNLQTFRQLQPGLPWDQLTQNMQTPSDWRELMADLRRVITEDPGNATAQEYLARATKQSTAN